MAVLEAAFRDFLESCEGVCYLAVGDSHQTGSDAPPELLERLRDLEQGGRVNLAPLSACEWDSNGCVDPVGGCRCAVYTLSEPELVAGCMHVQYEY